MAYNWKQDLPRLEQKYGLPPGLLGALVRGESGGRINARSPVGAIGLTQLMPATAKGLGVNPHDPRQNLEGGAKYLAQQLKTFRDPKKALAAYNAGPGAVKKYGGIPPYKETQGYVKRVTGYWKESSRYGQKGHSSRRPTRRGMQVAHRAGQAPLPVPGGDRPITPVPIPEAAPKPFRKYEPGLEDHDIVGLNQALHRKPHVAQAIIDQRMRKQNEYDQQYDSQLTTYETRQQEIQAAQELNQQRMQMPDKFPTGATVGQRLVPGHPSGGLGGVGGSKSSVWNPNGKYVKTPGGWVRNLNPNEDRYKFLQRLGGGFGLRNDAGNSQTFGGNHSAGSYHYQRRAVDFGDAKNSRKQLYTFAEWARANAKNIRELYYNPLGWHIENGKVIKGPGASGHDRHLHIAW